MNKYFKDKRILIVYCLVIFLFIVGITYALQSTSLSLGLTTALVGIDEDAYGSTDFDSSELDFKPILDTEVETSTDNVIKIDFSVGGAETNNNENIIYDIALNALDVNCNLLSPYIKWKLVKEGTEISSGSLDYKFDTIDENGRLVLTTIQEDLPDYNADDKSGYDNYTFYMWFSDSCQSEDITTCTSAVDQSSLLGQNLSGRVEVELYTESKQELTRNPGTTVTDSLCDGAYAVSFVTSGGSEEENVSVFVGSTYGSLPTPTRTDVVTFDTLGGNDIVEVNNTSGEEATIVDTANTFSFLPRVKLLESDTNTMVINYTFEGWYMDKELTIPVDSDTEVTADKNHSLYAKWSGDNKITLPSVTKAYNEFLGWYSDKELKVKVGDAGDTYEVMSDKTLYAGWDIKYLPITLNDNEGTGGVGTIYVVPGEGFFSDEELTTQITSIITPTRVGYTFSGYTGLTDSEGNITASVDAYTESTTISASWTANTYTINYYNGSTKLGSSTHTYDTAKALTTWATLGGSITNSSYGWAFAGWSTSSTSTTRTYTNGQSVTNLSSTSGGTINLYAVYSRTITFKSGVSSSTSSTATQYWNPYGTTNGTHVAGVTSPALTAITNWSSLGFRNDTTASSKEYSASTTIYPAVAESATLYGVYSRTLTIVYNSNGGSGTTSSTTKTVYLNSNSTTTSSQAVTLASNSFTYDGYAFSKWAAGSASGTQYSAGASYTAGLAYNSSGFSVGMYAIWIEKVYEVSAVNSGYNTYQATLANAVTAATSGATIKLLKTKTDSSNASVASTKSLTLNTNGYTLTRTGYTDINGGTFTVNGSGKIIRGTSDTCQYLFYMYGGNLSIGAVTISDSDTSSCATPLIENVGTGTITVNTGASITSPRNTLKMSGSGGITLAGGTVAGTGDYHTIYAGSSSTGTITVSGGTVTHTGASDYAISTAVASSAPLKITSGTVSGTYYAVKVGGTFTMSGGTISTTTTSTSSTYQGLRILEGATATITGGTIQVSSASRAIYNSGTLTINGTGVTIYSSNSTTGVAIRVDGENAVLYFAAGKAQSTGNYGLYAINSSKVYINYDSSSGKGNLAADGVYISSKSGHAIYGSSSASIYYGTLTYAGPDYAPTALVGAEGKYAFYCASDVTTCDWRGGRLFSYELFYEMNSYVTDHSDTNMISYDEFSSTKTWNGSVSGYGLQYNVKAYYDA